MATPLTYQKIQTSTGAISIPIYNPVDVVYPNLRVMTGNGLGAYDLVPVSDTLQLRIMTPDGVKAFNTVIVSDGELPIFDSFTRPDSTTTLGTTETGQLWKSYVTNNVWGIQNNQAYPVTPDWDSPVYVEAGVSDNVSLQVTIATVHSQQQVFWRVSDNQNYFLLQGNTVSQVTNGSYVSKGTITPPMVNGDIFRVDLVGDKHVISVNGFAKFSFVSLGFINETKFGFSGNAAGTLLRYDNFLIEPNPETIIPDGPAINIVEDFLDDTYSFAFIQDVIPWNRFNTASLDGNLGHIKSSNQGVNASVSQIVFTIPVPVATRSWIEVDYSVDSEPSFDFFYIYINGVEKLKVAGTNQIGMFTADLPPGTHKLQLRFSKDGGAQAGTDSAYISGIRLKHT